MLNNCKPIGVIVSLPQKEYRFDGPVHIRPQYATL